MVNKVVTKHEVKRGRPTKGQPALNANSILVCAKSLLKEQGKPPSIRKLAEALGVDAMAIYHYYDNKNALLEAIATSLMDDICVDEDSGSWQQNIRALSYRYLKLLEENSGLLDIFFAMETEGPAEIFTRYFQEILQTLNLPEQVVKDALDLLADYLHGFAFAMSCQKDKVPEWDLAMVDGPIKLICKSIEAYC